MTLLINCYSVSSWYFKNHLKICMIAIPIFQSIVFFMWNDDFSRYVSRVKIVQSYYYEIKEKKLAYSCGKMDCRFQFNSKQIINRFILLVKFV